MHACNVENTSSGFIFILYFPFSVQNSPWTENRALQQAVKRIIFMHEVL